uniref:Uncharacterized protein n=1 Tax=Arundo donax TaxID=35708 RepID=A0A0A8Y1T9_ARUDO
MGRYDPNGKVEGTNHFSTKYHKLKYNNMLQIVSGCYDP